MAVIQSRGLPSEKTVKQVLTGSSYTHLIELTAKGPNAMGIVGFSQATEKTSPWYFDQLPLFSAGKMFKFPYTATEIKADLKSKRVF